MNIQKFLADCSDEIHKIKTKQQLEDFYCVMINKRDGLNTSTLLQVLFAIGYETVGADATWIQLNYWGDDDPSFEFNDKVTIALMIDNMAATDLDKYKYSLTDFMFDMGDYTTIIATPEMFKGLVKPTDNMNDFALEISKLKADQIKKVYVKELLKLPIVKGMEDIFQKLVNNCPEVKMFCDCIDGAKEQYCIELK